MASMFDVSTTMSQIADQQAQQMGDIQAQVDRLDDKVNNLKIDFNDSLISIDDSIQKIIDVTDSMMSTTQSAIEEQQVQIQILESEEEVENLKNKKNRNSNNDPSMLIRSLEDKIEMMKFNVKKLLDGISSNKTSVADIGSSARAALGTALAGVFGASVLTYLFSDKENPSSAETASEGGNQEGSEESSEGSGASEMSDEKETENSNNAISEKPPQEAPGEDVEKPQQEAPSEDVEQKNQQTEVKPLNDMADQKAKTPKEEITKVESSIVLRERAITSGELIKTDDAYYYPDGKVVNVNKGLSSAEETKLIESGAELYTKFLMEDNEENRKDFPGLWDDKKEQVTANTPSTGNQLVKSNEQVEKSEDKVRASIAQNMITVINKSESSSEPEPKKTPAIIGKITSDQILKG